LKLTGDHVAVRNVTVLGFGICYKSFKGDNGAGKHLEIDHLRGDCDTGISIDQSPSASQFSGFSIVSPLTGNNGDGSLAAWNITAIAANTSGAHIGSYNVTVSLDCSKFSFVNGDIVWISMTPG